MGGVHSLVCHCCSIWDKYTLIHISLQKPHNYHTNLRRAKLQGMKTRNISVVVGPLPKLGSNSGLEARHCRGQDGLLTTFRIQSLGHICSHMGSELANSRKQVKSPSCEGSSCVIKGLKIRIQIWPNRLQDAVIQLKPTHS